MFQHPHIIQLYEVFLTPRYLGECTQHHISRIRYVMDRQMTAPCYDTNLSHAHPAAMVLEYVNGVDLVTFVASQGGRLGEDMGRCIFQQLILAVSFCHRVGKGHRDIKLGNVSREHGISSFVQKGSHLIGSHLTSCQCMAALAARDRCLTLLLLLSSL